MTIKGAFGHKWTDGLTHCVQCGVLMNDYERGAPYQCTGGPLSTLYSPRDLGASSGRYPRIMTFRGVGQPMVSYAMRESVALPLSVGG